MFFIGRNSKSKKKSDDLSSSSSLSSSHSLVSLDKNSHSNCLPSPSQVLTSSTNDFEKTKPKQNKQTRSRSALLSSNNRSDGLSPLQLSSSSSVYLIQVKNDTLQSNSFGLTKTVPYVWKNTTKTPENSENDPDTRFSVEQIPPTNNREKRTKPMSSRNVILERGQIDYWQNFESSPDSVITSSCHNSIGSASNLVGSSTFIIETKNDKDTQGNIISITTTKRNQPSLLNKTHHVQWNIEDNGKKHRCSKIKWHSDEELEKQNRLRSKNNTDVGSCRSAPLILHYDNNTNVSNETHKGIIYLN